MAAPTFVQVATASAQSTTVSVSAPAGTVSGDHQLIWLGIPSTSITVTSVPSGWTLERTQQNTNDATPFTLRCYKSSTATGSAAFTVSSSTTLTAVRETYRGGTGVESSVGSADASSTANHALGTATTTVADSLVVAAGYEDSSGTSKTHATSGWTERADFATSGLSRVGMIAAYDIVKATAGTQGGTIVSTGGNDYMATISVVLAADAGTTHDKGGGAAVQGVGSGVGIAEAGPTVAFVRGRDFGVYSTAATTHVIDLPTETQAGDSLFVWFANDEIADPTTGTAPDSTSATNGWVSLDSVKQGTSTNHRGTLLHLPSAEGTGADALTVTTAASVRTAYVSLAVANAGDPVVVTASAANSTGQTPPAHSTLTSGDYLSLVLLALDQNPPADQTIGVPSDYTDLVQAEAPPAGSSAASAFSMERSFTGVTSITPGAMTWTSNEQSVIFHVAIPSAGGTTHDETGGAAVQGVGSGAQAVTSATVHTETGGAATQAVGSGSATVDLADIHAETGGAAAQGVGSGTKVIDPPFVYTETGGAVAQGVGSGTKTVTAATVHAETGGAAATATGSGTALVDSPEVYAETGGAATQAVGSGSAVVDPADVHTETGGAAVRGVGAGSATVGSAATHDEAGGAAAQAVGAGTATVGSAGTHDEAGGAAAQAVGSGSATVDLADVHAESGGAAAQAVGSGAATVDSIDIYTETGGAVVRGVGSGSVSVSTTATHDEAGGAVTRAVAAGSKTVSSSTTHTEAGGAAVRGAGSGSATVDQAEIHTRSGGAAVRAVGSGSAVAGQITTYTKTGGAVGLRIAAGTKTVIYAADVDDLGETFVTLLHDIKVRVGDTWTSPTWAILLPGGFGVDLTDGWTIKASVKRHRADGGTVVHSWTQANGGITIGQAEVTLAGGSTVNTSTIKLRHTGATTSAWPIFVGSWDFEISKSDEDYTVAAGSFRTIREVTS